MWSPRRPTWGTRKHLKLVKAHLAALDVAKSTEAGPMGTVAPPSPEPSGGETDAGQTEVVPKEKERSPANRSRAGLVQRERKPAERAEGAPPPGAGGGVGVPCQ
jgi:hypothetical protein